MIAAIRAGWTTSIRPTATSSARCSFPMARPSRWRGTRICFGAPPRAETAVRLFEARGWLDVRDLAPQVRARTLVVHARDDRVVPVEEGRLLAALIPDARLVLLESANHILLADEPAWSYFLSELRRVPRNRAPGAPAAVTTVRLQRARARGARARRRRADERGDRRAALDQRPNRRATPLERLREARRLRARPAAPPRRSGSPSCRSRRRCVASGRLRVRRQRRRPEVGWLHRCRAAIARAYRRSPASEQREQHDGANGKLEAAPVAVAEPIATLRDPGRRRAEAPRPRMGRSEGSGAPARSTAGRRAISAGPSRSTAISPRGFGSSLSTSEATACPRSRWSQSTTPTAELWADDVAAVIEQTGLRAAGRRRLVVRRVRRHRLPRAPTATRGIAAIDLVGAAVILKPPTFDHIGPGLLENARTPATSDLATNIAAIRRFLRACTVDGARRATMDHGAGLEHGRATRVRGALISREIDGNDALSTCPSPCS